MADLVRMSSDDFEALSEQMRLANTARLKAVLDQLEIYVDGTMGMPSPPHVNAYIKVVRELGLLWKAYDRPGEAAKAGVDEELVALEARRAQVLAEFDKLRQVGRQSDARGRRAS